LTNRSRADHPAGLGIEAPDYFRISLTTSDQMVERALPAFAQAAR
jgi:hypothetical protein